MVKLGRWGNATAQNAERFLAPTETQYFILRPRVFGGYVVTIKSSLFKCLMATDGHQDFVQFAAAQLLTLTRMEKSILFQLAC